MTGAGIDAVQKLVTEQLQSAGIAPVAIDIREYPDETIVVVRVEPEQYDSAVQVAAGLDIEFTRLAFRGFVTIRKADVVPSGASGRLTTLTDPRAGDLATLLAARSRTSEIQPSLAYIPDATNTLASVIEPRNHLVFGRRGAGKTALLVEAKRTLDLQNHITAWINVQTVRSEGVWRAYLWAAQSALDAVQIRLRGAGSRFADQVFSLSENITALLAKSGTTADDARQLVPKLQRVISRSLTTLGCKLFLFIDDLHYLQRSDQPELLDALHGSFRDADAWLKIAAIRHLAKWFQSSPPLGLQSSHDAAHIDLDLTLESPSEAKSFLDRVLDAFAERAKLRSGSNVFSDSALDRLVLASGAVPRDYLELAASSIREARKRANANKVGVQDINRAAGEHSKVKLQELEEDAATSVEGGAQTLVRALNRIREFCLDEKRYTFFRVDFQDKERRPHEYSIVSALLDVKIIHLVAPSLSDKHEAGRRGEVYMLDLSQFSGQRFKKHLWVLDFVGGHLVLKKTSSNDDAKSGDTSRRLQEILRCGCRGIVNGQIGAS